MSAQHPHSNLDGIDLTPLADVEETVDGWTVEVEVPGVAEEDIEVAARGRTLVITGERKERERRRLLRRQQRVIGMFRYEITLGADLDPGGISTSVGDGDLTVTVRRADQGDQTTID